MERRTFELYWRYYLSVEKMLESTSQYVTPSKQNKDTYSDEFMKIILLSCSEIDSLLKVLCKENNVLLEERQYNMSVYADVLLKQNEIKKWAFTPKYSTSNCDDSIICFPFKGLDKNKPYAGLTWWKDYQKLKHNRVENAYVGNLENAIYALTAHFVMLLFLMDLLTKDMGQKYVKEKYWSNFLIVCV